MSHTDIDPGKHRDVSYVLKDLRSNVCPRKHMHCVLCVVRHFDVCIVQNVDQSFILINTRPVVNMSRTQDYSREMCHLLRMFGVNMCSDKHLEVWTTK